MSGYELDLEKDGVHYAPSAEMLSKRRNQMMPQALRAGRIPPQALEMEQAVLGALLLEKEALDKIAHYLTPEKFYKEGHRLIYEAVLALNTVGRPIDLLTVKNQLSGMGMLDAAGGVYYLTELTSKVANSSNIDHHARVIHQKWILRSMIIACDEAINKAYDETEDTFEIHSGLIKSLDELEPKTDELVNAMDYCPKIAKNIEAAMRGESPSIKIGFSGIDSEYAFDTGEYVLVAGDSGTGKTTFAIEVAKRIRAVYPDIPVLVNEQEMDGEKVVARDMASQMDISQMRFRTGNGIVPAHFARINELAAAYDGIYFCNEPSAAVLTAQSRRLKKQLGLPAKSRIVIINDYLQLCDGKGNNREQEIGEIAKDHKRMATKENALVIDLSQINESAGKARPNHKSIRESRAPYHHADWVMFLYSPSKNGEVTYENGASTTNIIEVILDKVRFGRPGNIVKLWMTNYGKMMDYEENEGDPEFPDPRRVQPRDITVSNTSRIDEDLESKSGGGGGDFYPF